MITKLTLNAACSAVALICATAGAPAWAQSTTPEQAADPAGPEQVPSEAQGDQVSGEETIVVTGTNISGVKPVGNTAITVTREDGVKAGYSTPAELLRTLPQVRLNQYDSEGGASSISLQNSAGSNSVSLRGLGGSAGTLILLDGRRTVQVGTNTNTTEANQVPIAAIERIEVVADGASAVYGSDAVAGVINYIIRKDFKGAELTVRGNNNLGGFEHGLDATLGTTWSSGLGDGNVLVAYGYTHREPWNQSRNPILRNNQLAVGGSDNRLDDTFAQVGFVPVIRVATTTPNTTLPRARANIYYGLPEGANVGLTAAQLRPNDPDVTDFSNFTDWTGKLERHQVALYANQELGENFELFFQGNYLNRDTRTRSNQGIFGSQPVLLRRFLRNSAGAVTATPNPYYVTGIPGVAPNADLNVYYPQLKDQGPRVYKGSDETYNLTGGIRANLPFGWKGEAFYTFGRSEGCGYCVINGFINGAALQYQIDIGAINPLSSVPLTAAQYATFSGAQTQIGHNGLDDAVIKFNGPLFDLPGGTVRAAFGGERMKSFNYNENTSVTGTNNAVTVLTTKENSYYNRTVWSAYGEVYVPLVGEEMNVPLIKSLIVNAAVRHDDYTDAGKTTNPKFGATWEVADFLSIYGSWGTSFVAPSLTDKNPSAYVSGTVTTVFQPYLPGATAAQRLALVDPRFSPIPALPEAFCNNFVPNACVVPNIGLLFGSNPQMQPQTSTNWTLGAEFKPGGGFRANINYYNIDFKNRIIVPRALPAFLAGRTPGSTPPDYRGYEQFIIPINNPATCSNADVTTADPALQQFLGRPIYAATGGVGSLGGFPNFCAVRGIVDLRFANIGRTKTEGLDIDVSWAGTAGEVALNASVQANVILRSVESAGPGAPELSNLNITEGPLKWRGRASVGAAYRGFTTTLFGNYLGSFTNTDNRAPVTNQSIAPVTIPAFTTFDLNLGYYTDFEGRQSGFLKGLRGSVTVINLFDRDPQRVLTSGNVYLAGRGSPFGRTVSFQLTGSF